MLCTQLTNLNWKWDCITLCALCLLVTVEGEDYNLTKTVIAFPDTSVAGATACATFTITDDNILELDEDFRVQITSPTDPPGLTISAQSSSTVVTIEDNEGKSSVVNELKVYLLHFNSLTTIRNNKIKYWHHHLLSFFSFQVNIRTDTPGR